MFASSYERSSEVKWLRTIKRDFARQLLLVYTWDPELACREESNSARSGLTRLPKQPACFPSLSSFSLSRLLSPHYPTNALFPLLPSCPLEEISLCTLPPLADDQGPGQLRGILQHTDSILFSTLLLSALLFLSLLLAIFPYVPHLFPARSLLQAVP